MFAMQRVRTNEGWAALLMAAAVALASSGCGGTPVVEDAGPPVDPLGLHDWADAVVRSTGSRWVGERLLEHDPEPRPESALRAVSSRAELHVHAPEGVPDSTAGPARPCAPPPPPVAVLTIKVVRIAVKACSA